MPAGFGEPAGGLDLEALAFAVGEKNAPPA